MIRWTSAGILREPYQLRRRSPADRPSWRAWAALARAAIQGSAYRRSRPISVSVPPRRPPRGRRGPGERGRLELDESRGIDPRRARDAIAHRGQGGCDARGPRLDRDATSAERGCLELGQPAGIDRRRAVRGRGRAGSCPCRRALERQTAPGERRGLELGQPGEIEVGNGRSVRRRHDNDLRLATDRGALAAAGGQQAHHQADAERGREHGDDGKRCSQLPVRYRHLSGGVVGHLGLPFPIAPTTEVGACWTSTIDPPGRGVIGRTTDDVRRASPRLRWRWIPRCGPSAARSSSGATRCSSSRIGCSTTYPPAGVDSSSRRRGRDRQDPARRGVSPERRGPRLLDRGGGGRAAGSRRSGGLDPRRRPPDDPLRAAGRARPAAARPVRCGQSPPREAGDDAS